VRFLPPARRPLADALALGPALLVRAGASGTSWLAASLVEGPAVVLGAVQRAGRVVDLAACAERGALVLRRATTGTAVFVGARAVVWTLALPHVAALVPDAAPRTLLNRNVRGFLKGFARAGAVAHYFGREWLSVRHRPAAVVGFDVARDGAVLLEVWAGHDAPPAIPDALAAPEERLLDRWLGRSPAALVEVLPAELGLEDLARIVMETVALRAVVPAVEAEAPPELESLAFRPIDAPGDPLPRGAGAAVLARVPIGWIEAAALDAGGVWLGGDLLTARWLLDELGRSEAPPAPVDAASAPIEGASLSDLLELAQRARSPDSG
jgi:hypothetical protein